MTTGAPVAVLFPGQGSQSPGMADPWASHPAGKAVLEECSAVFGRDLIEVCRDESALGTTEIVQPAVFACDVAAFRVLETEGVRFEAAAGHSLGEFAALVAGGVLQLEPAMRAVMIRGKAMQEASNQAPSTMTAVLGVSSEEAAELCAVAGRGDILEIANENAPGQVVLSGTVAAIERAEEFVRSKGGKAIRLRVAGAFHSPLMNPAVPSVRAAIADLDFHDARFPIVPNVNGKPTTDAAALRDLLSRQMVSPVRWEKAMRAMEELGIVRFLEAGPGDVLTKLARRCVRGAEAIPINTPEDAATFAAREKVG